MLKPLSMKTALVVTTALGAAACHSTSHKGDDPAPPISTTASAPPSNPTPPPTPAVSPSAPAPTPKSSAPAPTPPPATNASGSLETVTIGGVAYPYCTNSSSGTNGWGWQPGLAGAPNGGSCRIKGAAPSAAPTQPIGGYLASNGQTYAYCTNGSNDGIGWGWQPGLAGAQNGGSCKVPGTAGSNDMASPASVYTASNGLTYAYCTNGSNSGSGWGWQPGLAGTQNGGSCRVPGTTGSTTPTYKAPDGKIYPYCTNGSDNHANDGFGWQNNALCRIPGQ